MRTAFAMQPIVLSKIEKSDHGDSPLPVMRTMRRQVPLARAALMMLRTPM